MKITIDKAGRVVIPAAIRERVGLKAGTELEVLTDDIAIHLIPTGPEPEIQHRGRRKIAKPTAKADDLPKVDLVAIVDAERNRWPW